MPLFFQETLTGPIHTGHGMRCAMPCEQMGPVDVNGGVHTARKQHQRKNIPICACVASRVLCGLGHRKLEIRPDLRFSGTKVKVDNETEVERLLLFLMPKLLVLCQKLKWEGDLQYVPVLFHPHPRQFLILKKPGLVDTIGPFG